MTYSTEKLCLRWHDFQQNIVSNYKELHKEPDFSDVTLVCEEDHQIEAHRVILAACSPFFSGILKKNKHSHPMIYMRGLKAKDLVAMVDFIYHGEANVYQEDLPGFLALAEELKLKGLAGNEDNEPSLVEDNLVEQKTQKPKEPKQESVYQPKATHSIKSHAINTNVSYPLLPVDTGKLVAGFDTSTEDLKATLDSMMERIDDGDHKWKCTVCGKQSTRKDHSRTHVETHIEGLSYPCNQCSKVSRSSSGLAVHISAYHRK